MIAIALLTITGVLIISLLIWDYKGDKMKAEKRIRLAEIKREKKRDEALVSLLVNATGHTESVVQLLNERDTRELLPEGTWICDMDCEHCNEDCGSPF